MRLRNLELESSRFLNEFWEFIWIWFMLQFDTVDVLDQNFPEVFVARQWAFGTGASTCRESMRLTNDEGMHSQWPLPLSNSLERPFANAHVMMQDTYQQVLHCPKVSMHSSWGYYETKGLKGRLQIGIVCKLPAIKSEMVMSPYLVLRTSSPVTQCENGTCPGPDMVVRDRLKHRCHNSKVF
jgi:hypothetical protein